MLLEGEDAVAQVGLGGRAQSHDNAGFAQALALLGGRVRGVHETPSTIHGDQVHDPVDRRHALRLEAFAHFGGLLARVHVDRRGGIDAVHRLRELGELHGVHCARGVGRHAQAQQALAAMARDQFAQELGDRLGGAREAPLRGIERPMSETAVRVEHGQQRHRDAGAARRVHHAVRELSAVGVGFAGAVVMQVVELGDRRVALLEHLHVELQGDRADVLGLQARDEVVHRLAPGPEVVGRMAADLGEAGHGALERVRMQVGHAGQYRARSRGQAVARSRRRDARELARVVPIEAHIGGPATGQECGAGEERSLHGTL